MRVLRILPTLDVGGTEVQCVAVLDAIAQATSATSVRVDLVTLFRGSHLVADRRQGDWRWTGLDLPRSAAGLARGLPALRRHLLEADVVHALLWPAVWASAAAAPLAKPLVGSIHSTALPGADAQADTGSEPGSPIDDSGGHPPSWTYAAARRLGALSARASGEHTFKGSTLALGTPALARALRGSALGLAHPRVGARLRALVFNSQAGRSALAKTFGWRPELCDVIENGVECRAQTPSLTGRGDSPVICAARRLPSKRHDLLIAALARLAAVRCELLGAGTADPALASALRSAGLESRVHALGPVDDVRARLSRAPIAVLPTEHEGMPNAILEAWEAGATVLASRVPGVRELVHDGVDGLLVDNHVDAWVAGLGRLLNDEALRVRLAEAGRARVQARYSMPATAQRWLALYRRVHNTSA